VIALLSVIIFEPAGLDLQFESMIVSDLQKRPEFRCGFFDGFVKSNPIFWLLSDHLY